MNKTELDKLEAEWLKVSNEALGFQGGKHTMKKIPHWIAVWNRYRAAQLEYEKYLDAVRHSRGLRR